MIKRTLLLVILLFLSLCSLVQSVQAQSVDTAWVRRYNGPGRDTDSSHSVAIDASGNIYVSGSSYSSETSYDYATIKYYPNGDTAWVRIYNSPGNGDDRVTGMGFG